MNGPNGFWCRYCGDYQSARNPAQVKVAKAHHAAHEDRGDVLRPTRDRVWARATS